MANMKQSILTAGRYQKGASVFGVVVVLLIIAAFVSVGLKVIPAYVDHNLVAGVAETLADSGRAADMTQTEIRQEISNTLRVNNIRDFDINSVTSTRVENPTEISIVYERRIPLFTNIDIVISFDEKFE